MVNKAEGHDRNAATKLFALFEFSNNIWRYSEKNNVSQVTFSNISVVFVVRFALAYNTTKFIQKHLCELLFSNNVFENVVLKPGSKTWLAASVCCTFELF